MLPRSSEGSGIRRRRFPRPARVWLLAGLTAVSLAGCSGGDTPAPSIPAQSSQPAAAPAPATKPEIAPAAPLFVYEAKARRDPFRPLIAPRVAEPKPRPKTGLAALEVNELKLAGILWEQRGFLALVEAPTGLGYVLRVNDVIGGDARVARITPDAVTFEVKGATLLPQASARQVELRLRKEE